MHACAYACILFIYFFTSSFSHVVIGRLVLQGHLDAVGQEAEDGTGPEQDGEAAEKLTAELDPLRRGGGRSQGVRTVPGQNLHCSGVGQALGEEQFLGMNDFQSVRGILLQHNGPIFTVA